MAILIFKLSLENLEAFISNDSTLLHFSGFSIIFLIGKFFSSLLELK